jgi:hypothetical protein
MNDEEVIALLFPDRQGQDGPTPWRSRSCAVRGGSWNCVRCGDKALIRRALLTGRMNGSKPIRDPVTREIMGYEIEPITLPAA